MLTNDQKKLRAARKYLRDLTTAVEAHVAALDEALAEPTGHERGRHLAKLANELEMANNLAKRYGLNLKIKSTVRAIEAAPLVDVQTPTLSIETINTVVTQASRKTGIAQNDMERAWDALCAALEPFIRGQEFPDKHGGVGKA
jgi:hypothetical protein